MDTNNTPLLTAGTLPVALLTARIERLPSFWFSGGIIHYNTSGSAPVFVEERGAVTWVRPVQKLKGTKYELKNEAWYEDWATPSSRKRKRVA